MSPQMLTWIIAGLATAGVILRPFNLPEAVWAGSGAVLLVLLGLLSPEEFIQGAAKGTDVYLFLTGMMLLAEIARIEGLFDWLAAYATHQARGSQKDCSFASMSSERWSPLFFPTMRLRLS